MRKGYIFIIMLLSILLIVVIHIKMLLEENVEFHDFQKDSLIWAVFLNIFQKIMFFNQTWNIISKMNDVYAIKMQRQKPKCRGYLVRYYLCNIYSEKQFPTGKKASASRYKIHRNNIFFSHLVIFHSICNVLINHTDLFSNLFRLLSAMIFLKV